MAFSWAPEGLLMGSDPCKALKSFIGQGPCKASTWHVIEALPNRTLPGLVGVDPPRGPYAKQARRVRRTHTGRRADMQTHTSRQTDKPANTQTNKQTNDQTSKQTNRQTNRILHMAADDSMKVISSKLAFSYCILV